MLKSWASAIFVVLIFVLIWVSALLRLHHHLNGETFLHQGGITDSLLAILVPLAILARFWQIKIDRKARKG